MSQLRGRGRVSRERERPLRRKQVVPSYALVCFLDGMASSAVASGRSAGEIRIDM